MNPVAAVILVLFAPSRFVEVAVRHALEAEFATNVQWQAQYPDRNVPPKEIDRFRGFAREQTQSLRRAVFGGIGIAFAAIASGLVAGAILRHLLGPAPVIAIAGLQIGGAGIILGATLAEVGRQIASWQQETLPEKVNRWVFRCLYVFGTFIFVISVGWSGR